MKLLVSLVITTKNEEKNVENCMKSIAAQSYSDIETILVDNGSIKRFSKMLSLFFRLTYDTIYSKPDWQT